MIISVTERGEYKRCRRRWFLGSRNRKGLTTIVPPTALALGTFVHEALGHWLLDQSTSPKVYFMRAAKSARDLAIETYAAQVGAPITDSEIQNMDDAILQGFSMVENYEKHWKSPLPEDYELVAQEQRLCVPIPGTAHMSEYVWDEEQERVKLVTYDTAQYHYLEGRIDGIIKDSRNRLYVLEHKTYTNRPRIETLYANDQFLAYTWMLKQMEDTFGMKVAGVAYDGLWKRAAPPKTVDGHTGVLADLFIRKRLERSPEELAEFELELAYEALEMGNDPAIYKNRTSDGSCHWGCIFDRLCMAMSRGEDAEDILARKFTKKANEVEVEKEVA